MNDTPRPQRLRAAARPARRPALGRARALALGAVAWALVCGIAQAQSTEGLARLVATDAARLLRDGDPVVRGEAALVVAEASALAFHTTLVQAASDPDAAARHRAIVALGLQGTPGTAVVLDQILADADAGEPDRVVAAFALGLLPAEHASALQSRVLTGFLRGNQRREHDAVMALLLGLSLRDPGPQAPALLRILEDGPRDGQLRAQVLHLLLQGGHTFDVRQQRRLLERGSDEERLALLRGCVATGADAELLPVVERLARHGSTAVRTAALAAMARARYLPGLELAARAMQSSDPDECGQAMRAVLAIGGAGMMRALEQHVIDERDARRKAGLLRYYEAPPSIALLDHCASLATDPGQPFDVRTAAATLLARSDPQRAGAIVRDLFRATTRAEALPQLAELLVREDEPAPLDKLLDGPTDLAQHPDRFRALLAVEHPSAVRQLLAALQGPGKPEARAQALRLWRGARVLSVPRPVVGEAPAVLRELLD